jgi:hypothetical protein
MPFVVKQNEAPRPIKIGCLGTNALVPHTLQQFVLQRMRVQGLEPSRQVDVFTDVICNV